MLVEQEEVVHLGQIQHTRQQRTLVEFKLEMVRFTSPSRLVLLAIIFRELIVLLV